MMELVWVILTIVVLVAILLPVYQKVRVRGQMTLATQAIKNMVTALELYFADWGQYPPDDESGGSVCPKTSISLMQGLESTVAGRAYLEVSAEYRDASRGYIDPWGMPYAYNYDSGIEVSGVGYDYNIWSYGPDRQDRFGVEPYSTPLFAGDDITSVQ